MWKADHNGIWVHKGTMETNHQLGTLESNKEDWHKQSTLKYLIYFFYVLLKWEIIYYTSALYIISNQKRNKYCIVKFIALVWTSIPLKTTANVWPTHQKNCFNQYRLLWNFNNVTKINFTFLYISSLFFE